MELKNTKYNKLVQTSLWHENYACDIELISLSFEKLCKSRAAQAHTLTDRVFSPLWQQQTQYQLHDTGAKEPLKTEIIIFGMTVTILIWK